MLENWNFYFQAKTVLTQTQSQKKLSSQVNQKLKKLWLKSSKYILKFVELVPSVLCLSSIRSSLQFDLSETFKVRSIFWFGGENLNQKMTLEDDFEGSLTENDPSINETSPLLENEFSEGPRNPPKDDYHKVYVVFFLLGMGTLLPWNFFISLNSFWDYKFRNVSADNLTLIGEEKTDLQKQFASMLAWVILLDVY